MVNLKTTTTTYITSYLAKPTQSTEIFSAGLTKKIFYSNQYHNSQSFMKIVWMIADDAKFFGFIFF